MKSKFEIEAVHPDKIFIKDMNGDISVTNDAEAVVAEINAFFPEKRIIYLDSMGEWAELLHKGDRFIGFKYYEVF